MIAHHRVKNAGKPVAGDAPSTDLSKLNLGCGGSNKNPEKMKGRKLFIVARDDLGPSDIPRLPQIREKYERTPGPKKLIILEGSAHAQFNFATDQGDRVISEILQFLSEE